MGLPVTTDRMAGQDSAYDVQRTLVTAAYTKMTASGSIKGAAGTPGVLLGAICIAGTSPTLQIFNNSSAAGDQIIPTITGTVGQVVHFGGIGIEAPLGLWAVIGGTSPQWLLLWK